MEQYGYDASFVGETPDYLVCVLCHLAMRDPVMIITCGHKYCGPCFERLKTKISAATNNNQQQLTCPVDNAVIDVSQVVPDLGLARVIGCLVVTCDNQPHGCQWEGELSELPSHHKKCKYVLPPPQASDIQDILASIARLEKRIVVAEKRAVVAENRAEVAENRAVVAEHRAEVAEKDVTHMSYMLKEHTIKIKELEEKDRNKAKEIEELRNSFAKDKAEEIGELGAAASSCSKPVKVKRSVLLKLHRGSPKQVTVSPNNSVHFIDWYASVAAPDAVVKKDDKVIYEVAVNWSGDYGPDVLIGWATNGFTPNNSDMCVGNCENSWGFDPVDGYKWHNNNSTQWDNECERDGRDVLGVALDMVRGEMLYGWNGVWDPPLGVALNVDTNLQLFPAISGIDIHVEVNFGDAPFSYGGPDPSYKSLFEM